jgi:Spy/CpxP family protein refolding chaperone
MARHLMRAVLSIALAVTMTGFSAWAEPPARGDPAQRDSPDGVLRHLLEHAKDLGLSEGQAAYVNALQLNFELTRVTTEAERVVAEREIAALMQNDSVDISVVEAKIRHSEELEAGLRVTAVKTLRKALAVLTPDQREKYRRTLAAIQTGVTGKLLTRHTSLVTRYGPRRPGGDHWGRHHV